MTSRLDRLFVLLEAGSGPATRRAAARQLGEVQKAHPEELHRLLGRLMRYLQSPAWETRVAASQAVEAILSNVPEWNPPPGDGLKEEELDPEVSLRLKCSTFDVDRVLKDGAHLTGSEGREYDMEEEALSTAEANEKLAKQRQQLNHTLGLDVAATLGVDMGTVFTNDDLVLTNKTMPVKMEPEKRPVQELVTLPNSKPLSSREMNLAKRKARQAAFSKQKSRDCEEGSSAPSTPTDEPDRKKVKLEPEELYSDTGLPTPDGAGGWGLARAGWPLERWCGTLRALLFSGAWEARHGAATALRALLRGARAAGAGRRAGLTASQMEEAHQDWLEDMALRLVCVLALDRFGDFVSDQVVAPVRETSAQALGAVLARLSRDRALGVARALRRLAAHAQWEARHGALLACKYLVAARQDLAVESGALQHLISGLSDAAEDVSAVAAAALVPAADTLANTLGPGLKEVVSRLWRLLAEQDELAAPAHAYLALLAALMSIPEAAKLLHPIDLCDVLPRLWPYLAHSTSSVRRATLQTLCTITQPLASVLRQNKKEDKNTEQTNGSESAEQDLLWTPELLQEAMRHVYQRILFEHVHDIQNIAMQVWENLIRYSCLGALLVAACPMLAAWLCAAMAAPRAPVDAALLLQPPAKERRQKQGSLQTDTVPPELRPPQKWYIGGSESQTQSVRERNVMRARVKAADAIGLLSCYLVQPAPGIEYKTKEESPIECYVKVLIVYLRSGSALQRLVCALATAAWARRAKGTTHLKPTSESETETTQVSQDCESNGGVNSASETKDCGVNSASETKDVCAVCGSETVAPPSLAEALHSALLQPLYYDELAFSCNKILQEARDLLAMMKHDYKLPVDGAEFNNILRLEQVIHMATVTEPMIAAMKLKRVATTLEERRTSVLNAAKQCSVEQATLNVSVQAALAGACAHLHCLPEKLNPVIRPLMESIKKEPSVELQELAAGSLAALLEQLRDREPCPNGKVLHNLKTFLRCDPDVTPRATLCAALSGDEARESGSDSGADTRSPTDNCPQLDQYSGILTLWEYQRAADKLTPKRGRPPALAADLDGVLGGQDESQRQTDIQRRGAALALSELTKRADARLPTLLPPLWEMLSAPLLAPLSDEELENQDVESADSLISRLQVFETVCPALHPALFARLCPPGAGEGAGAGAAGGLLALVRLTRHKRTAVRHMAARCLAAAVAKQPELAPILADELLPQLASLSHARGRCGAAEALARVVAALQLAIVPYIALLVVPLLGRMSDPCPSVRVMSTRCFATLVQLMPLDGAVAEPRGLSPALRARRDRDKAFLARLFRPAAIEDYAVPVPVAATLRSYQQAGVNWLRFLYEYQLHGVLCDDMGLGKTLQCICVVAGAHWEQRGAGPLPSLVVCPPTLTGHWVFEVNKFIPSNYLKPLQYVGPPAERERLRSQVRFYNLIVASYDIVRKDIDFFSKLRWNYCILDEGHVIKNGKTKAFKAIKQIIANHRLILSGTPIQNNVLELWSLFDFLMPGLLGSERQFTAQYSRPILAARDARATPHQLQAGALACEALHRQVLPFLLRRVKEDVLKELPPKITQDYYCELSPLQRRLYDGLALPGGDAGAAAGHAHVFQALHYLQNVCNHPKLVLKPAHPEAAAVARQMTAEGGSLDDIHHAAKLPALKQLLLDCGIGTIDSSKDTEAPVVSQHRALIFCQLKKMLDIVEHDLLKRHLPSVSYLRLDGSVPAGARHAVVDRFNTDPSIDVLLLTTQVGGLGLNLTGADTVIFVEHDWNPMKDLQAMDRAHRIGQRRVVNVYRLVTRGTLEEKIMGLQKFKLQTANTVISSENAAMETMGTEQLLDIVQQCRGGVGLGAGPAGTSSVLDCLPELWEQSQYEEEYDMGSFLEGLRRGQGE